MSQESTKLKNSCKRLIKRIFREEESRCLPCVFCKSLHKTNYTGIERAHILRRSDLTKYIYQIMNILPLCPDHHGLLHDDNESEELFFKWLQQYLPLHFAWWEQHLNERVQTIPPTYWEGLKKELKIFADNPNEAYRKIFEEI